MFEKVLNMPLSRQYNIYYFLILTKNPNRTKNFYIVCCLYCNIVEEEGEVREDGEYNKKKIHTLHSVP